MCSTSLSSRGLVGAIVSTLVENHDFLPQLVSHALVGKPSFSACGDVCVWRELWMVNCYRYNNGCPPTVIVTMMVAIEIWLVVRLERKRLCQRSRQNIRRVVNW